MNDPIHTIMDELIAKYLSYEATEAEKATVDQWINDSDENKKQFNHFKLLWTESKKLLGESNIDENTAWLKLKARMHEPKTKIVSINRNYNWLKNIAAIFILLAGSLFVKNIFFTSIKNELLVVQTNKNIITDTLPDGSLVTLNKNSSITYNQAFTNKNTRNVQLKGEAFFNVTANKNKPFIINVNGVSIKVVGTSFNVKTINGKVEVIVKTGIVEVSNKNKMIILNASQKVLTDSTTINLNKQETNDKLYNHYQLKEFVCDNTPLWRLVEVLNEAYETNIIIERADLKNLLLTTTFTNENLDTILEIIATTFTLDVVKKEGKIILK